MVFPLEGDKKLPSKTRPEVILDLDVAFQTRSDEAFPSLSSALLYMGPCFTKGTSRCIEGDLNLLTEAIISKLLTEVINQVTSQVIFS